ncbi:toll-like receptor 3 [Lytechinus pictus]|uniref:toll-like receptor 3 n=1 Tax=Lytechinus pictus TaxID=7653 RepID=UPI0030B9BE2B
MACLIRLCWFLVFVLRVTSRRYEMMTRKAPENDPTSTRILRAFTSEKCDFDVIAKRAGCRQRGLAKIPDDLPTDALRLDLSLNNIRSLRNVSFIRYTALLFLDLSKNDITTIQPEAFKPLENLATLDLSDNPSLSSIHYLQWLHQLELLLLNGCNFTSLPDEVLGISSKFLNLDMSYNNLASVNVTICSDLVLPDLNIGYNGIESITPETFVILCPMDTIDMQNPITSIDPAAIAPLNAQNLVVGAFPTTNAVLTQLFQGAAISSIKEISIIGSGLDAIIPDLFSPLSNASLFSLDLSFNDFISLNHSIFSNLTTLYRLSLSGNYIREIEPEHFAGMKELRILDLGYNEVQTINPKNSTWEINLHELYLLDNSLIHIASFSFSGLNTLVLLDLSNNEYLSSLEIGAFDGLEKLKILDVPGCKLLEMLLWAPLLTSFNIRQRVPYFGDDSFIPGETFKTAPLLEFIDMTGSIMLVNSLWDSSRNLSLFSGLAYLRALFLDNNPLGGFPVFVFSNLTSLQKLSVVKCEIPFLEMGLFSDLRSLKELHLQQNYLTHLSSDLLQGLTNLLALHVDDNHLSYFSKDAFTEIPLLTTLTLTNNDLTAFNSSSFDPVMSTLTAISLVNNPIVCSCKIRWMVEWLNGDIHLINADQTYCSSASLDPLKQKPLLTFQPDEFCSPNTTLISLLVLTGIGVIMIALMMYSNRWALKYKIFLLKLAILGYDEMEDARGHDEFTYDINVMCDDEDDQWMKDHFKPLIEEKLPDLNRNIYGDEDLIIGMHYLDSVHYIVERSYKIVLLLSRNAFRNNWFLVKFRIALDNVNESQIENMVVVFLEDIPDAELPFLVRLFLSDHGTYLTWSKNEQEQEYFWTKFVKLMKVNRRSNHIIPPE